MKKGALVGPLVGQRMVRMISNASRCTASGKNGKH